MKLDNIITVSQNKILYYKKDPRATKNARQVLLGSNTKHSKREKSHLLYLSTIFNYQLNEENTLLCFFYNQYKPRPILFPTGAEISLLGQ